MACELRPEAILSGNPSRARCIFEGLQGSRGERVSSNLRFSGVAGSFADAPTARRFDFSSPYQ